MSTWRGASVRVYSSVCAYVIHKKETIVYMRTVYVVLLFGITHDAYEGSNMKGAPYKAWCSFMNKMAISIFAITYGFIHSFILANRDLNGIDIFWPTEELNIHMKRIVSESKDLLSVLYPYVKTSIQIYMMSYQFIYYLKYT